MDGLFQICILVVRRWIGSGERFAFEQVCFRHVLQGQGEIAAGFIQRVAVSDGAGSSRTVASTIASDHL